MAKKTDLQIGGKRHQGVAVFRGIGTWDGEEEKMKLPFLIPIAKFVQRIFYIFLDISGILLGVFLFSLGVWILAGNAVGQTIGVLVLILGICAFLIHIGHYFSWKLTRWIFGSDDYFKNRPK